MMDSSCVVKRDQVLNRNQQGRHWEVSPALLAAQSLTKLSLGTPRCLHVYWFLWAFKDGKAHRSCHNLRINNYSTDPHTKYENSTSILSKLPKNGLSWILRGEKEKKWHLTDLSSVEKYSNPPSPSTVLLCEVSVICTQPKSENI